MKSWNDIEHALMTRFLRMIKNLYCLILYIVVLQNISKGLINMLKELIRI